MTSTASNAARTLAALRKCVPVMCARCGIVALRYVGARYCSRRCKDAMTGTERKARWRARKRVRARLDSAPGRAVIEKAPESPG